MPAGEVLEFSGVTKRFGSVTAVDDLSARVEPGLVTGFLGPNGAGKTTTLRVLLGLVRPSAGTATIGGVPYRSLANPLQSVGAVLEASSFHPGRSGAGHLAVYADAAGVRRARVDELLELVGLADAAGRKVGGYSLGMRQRLGLAAALLGDPGVLVLDEPTNGLDPEGIKWIRGFLQQLAREGRTVLVSSHLLAEVQQTVDALLIISHGRLVFQGGIEDLADPDDHATVTDAPDREALIAALTDAGIGFEVLRSGLSVRGAEPAEIGRIAADAGVALSSLHRRGPGLEEVFLDLVNGTRVHPSAAGAVAATVAVPDPVAGSEPETDAGVETDAVAAEADAAEAVPEQAPEQSIEAEPEPEAEAEPEADRQSEQDPAAETDVEPEPTPEPASDTPAETADEASVADPGDDDTPTLPDDEDSDRPWEDYVRTDADVDADAFFASYDSPHNPGEPEHDPGEPEPDVPAEPDVPDDEHPAADDTADGGEQR